MTDFQEFESEFGKVVINIVSGESFASVSAYAKMSTRSRSAISDRLDDLDGSFTVGSIANTKVSVKTARGLKTCRLITETLITSWIVDDNPELAKAMLQAGTRLYLHKLAGFQFVAIAPQQESNMVLSEIMSLRNELKDQMHESKAREVKYLEDAEKYRDLSNQRLDSMYEMYPKYFRMSDIDRGLRKFPQLEELLKKVSVELENTKIEHFYPLSYYTKGYNLKHGEKISVGQDVSGWLKLSNNKMLKKLREYQNSKNLYPLCAKPLIEFAIKGVLANR
jgi:hypothetical protein